MDSNARDIFVYNCVLNHASARFTTTLRPDFVMSRDWRDVYEIEKKEDEWDFITRVGPCGNYDMAVVLPPEFE